MKKYFSLYPTTHYIKDDIEGALYNTLNGQIIGLNREQIEIIEQALDGYEVNSFKSDEIEFLKLLEKNILGSFYDNKIKIETTYWGSNKYFEKMLDSRKKIEILQIELTNKCPYCCKFCDKNSNLVYRRTGCKKWNNKADNLSLNEWIDLINQAYLIGCRKIEIFGGDPVIEWDILSNIIIFSNKLGIKDISLYTTGILIDDVKIKFMIEHRVHCIIQIIKFDNNMSVLGIDREINYKSVIEKFLDDNLDFEILLLINKYNEDKIDEYINFMKDSNINFKIDFIYPNPKNDYFSKKYSKFLLNYKKHIIQCNPVNFGVLLNKNACYYNRIGIGLDGEIYPCILSRRESYGNFRENNKLVDNLNSKFEFFKNLNKDKYSYCKSCVYRYGCLTCSAIDYNSDKTELNCINCSRVGNSNE